MRVIHSVWLALLAASVLLGGCGGGNSTQTTFSGGGLNAQGASPPVSLSFVQAANNLPVTVENWQPAGFTSVPNANLMYASVTVCVPGTTQCATVDHVQVDTGSVGLRLLASTVAQLHLPAISTAAGTQWECYQFVVGGLWGANASADIVLGQQKALAVPIQLIQDSSTGLQPPANCANAALPSQMLNSAAALGANGILGVGSVTLDCGANCQSGNYSASGYNQYVNCPVGTTVSDNCPAAAVPLNYQTFNPVAAIADPNYNNGLVISMPAVGALGALSATGEIDLGVGTAGNNQVTGLTQVKLGTAHPLTNSYLSVNTVFAGQTYADSYLDTGTNLLSFRDAAIPQCASGFWYCPTSTLALSAVLSDGDVPGQHATAVGFGVANTDTLFITTNAAFSNLAAVPPSGVVTTFAWGMPFFYGRRVAMSIWDLQSATGPWYAWSPL